MILDPSLIKFSFKFMFLKNASISDETGLLMKLVWQHSKMALRVVKYRCYCWNKMGKYRVKDLARQFRGSFSSQANSSSTAYDTGFGTFRDGSVLYSTLQLHSSFASKV